MSEYKDTKTYVVSWMNFYDNSLQMQQVEALHAYHAIQESDQNAVSAIELHTCTSMEELQDAAFDRDALIAVLEIT